MFSYLVAQAAHVGHMKRLRCLLEHGADPNAVSNYTGKTCYQSAVIAGRADVRALLLEFGATELPIEGKDAFVAACNRLDRDEAERLLDGHPEYLQDVQVLLDAAQGGAVPVVRLLLELGMDPNRESKHGHRALHQGVQHREVCNLLWQHGADPASRCYGGTPCDWALHSGDVESARFHAENSRLLLDAVATGHIALARELLDENPERIHERTPWGDTALHRLPEDPEQAQALIEILIERGAVPGATNDEGKTAGGKLDAAGLDAIADMLALAVEAQAVKAQFDTRG
jgi:ankyrin repeat protein